MNRIVSKAVFSLLVSGAVSSAFAAHSTASSPVSPGFFVGGGFAAARSSEPLETNVWLSSAKSTTDYKSDPFNFSFGLAPQLQLGGWWSLDNNWLWGVQFSYVFLNRYVGNDYKRELAGDISTPASVPAVEFDYPDKVKANGNFYGTELNHELSLLVFLGSQYKCGYFYAGIGPAALMLKDVYVLFASNSEPAKLFKQGKTLITGAARLGLTYYLSPSVFTDVNYTFLVSRSKTTKISEKVAKALNDGNMKIATHLGVHQVNWALNWVFKM